MQQEIHDCLADLKSQWGLRRVEPKCMESTENTEIALDIIVVLPVCDAACNPVLPIQCFQPTSASDKVLNYYD